MWLLVAGCCSLWVVVGVVVFVVVIVVVVVNDW